VFGQDTRQRREEAGHIALSDAVFIFAMHSLHRCRVVVAPPLITVMTTVAGFLLHSSQSMERLLSGLGKLAFSCDFQKHGLEYSCAERVLDGRGMGRV
jgi:hypothetical protein